jgi:hypothetical protein
MKYAAVALLMIGLMQMVGDLCGLPALRGIGTATTASPAPKVFSAVQGFETYSTRFFVEWTDTAGTVHSLQLTPEVYARLAGPYNRRNVYGAVLAYGPVLATDPRTQPMFLAVTQYALCGEAPLLRELGIDSANLTDQVRVRFEPLPGTELGQLSQVLEPACQ